jgi:GT2 family glycosyltransferase
MARISIVILNFNGRAFLEKFLPSIIRFSPQYEIVVADNHSTDNSLEYLHKTHPQIRIIEFSENYGYCGGYNRALAQLDADYFVILNSDIEVTKNWIDPVIALFESDAQIAAVQPKLLDFNHKHKFEYAGGAGGYIDTFGYPFCRGRIFDTIETDSGQYDDTREIFWATGACFFVRGEFFKKYGGFDEVFFAHMEEIDLCWRMKSDGLKVYYCGASVVYHVGGGTLTYANPRKTYLNFRNSLLVLIKNLPLGELVWKLPFRWLIDYVAVLNFFRSGRFKDGLMIFKAHIYVILHFYFTYKTSRNGKKELKNTTGRYKKFLLFDYHIGKVRNFKDLKF